ncbi:unnamed protein product [Oikopleura dioica]|uniref:non-specific serine/threonine protein kinase n=1 Tax=Oikopleura dioica TaxID=34765 RepID=E4WR92_OIKDI|nr:unnamed protein product [Oikopleura dioica]
MPGRQSDYTVVQQIGVGSFGTCCLVKRLADGQKFVWKEVRYGNMREAEKESLVREVNLLRDLRHPHIVRYIDRIVSKSSSTLYLVMEYCAGGDLAQLIQDRKQKRLAGRLNSMVPQEFVLKVFYQLLQALKELHLNQQGKILHRDLKPANVFLTSAMGDVKLGDFGLARVLSSEVSMAISYVGTPYYMSPEQVAKMRYNESSDVWSLGCLIYELCALHPPFTAKDQKELYGKIKKGEFRRIPHAYSDELFTTLSSMLKQNPEQRPTVQSLLQMSFINPSIMPKPKRSTTPRVSRVGSLKRDSIATKDSINSSGYKSNDTNTSTPISKPSPPFNKQRHSQLHKPSTIKSLGWAGRQK